MTNRTASRTDANQAAIVDIYRGYGISVACTHAAGDGFPDLVLGVGNRNYMVEIKNGDLPPSKRKLTPDQVEFHRDWKGSISIIETEHQAHDHARKILLMAANRE